MKEIIEGKAWVLGDNIDTDIIIPAKYLQIEDINELAKHTMEYFNSSFAADVEPGDVIVAGENFGSGSSREQAVLVLKTLKLGAIICRSCSRIFFRNALNNGLPVITINNSIDKIKQGDRLRIIFKKGLIKNLICNKELSFKSFSEFELNLMGKGGVINLLKNLGN